MPTNDFLPIGTAGGANVQGQVAYAANQNRTAFWPNGGVPGATEHGKMFRQSSSIAAMVAAAIVALGLDMFDDGNAAVQLSNFQSLLQQVSTLNYVADTGSANAYTIAPAPAITAYKGGMKFAFIPANASTGACTLNVNGIGTRPIVHADGSALNPGDIPTGGLVEVVYQATINKFILNTFTPGKFSIGSGYFTIPGTPLLVQFFSYSLTGAPSSVNVPSPVRWLNSTVTFPITFPNAVIGLWGAPGINTDGQLVTVAAQILSNNTASLYVSSSASVNTYTGTVFVIGY